MSQWKCNTCKGTYSDVLPDGSVYYHACAPGAPDAQGVQHELANKRDENLAIDATGHVRGIRAAGAGVTA